MKHHLITPISEQDIKTLKAGDLVEISGVIYTGRDAAHKRLVEDIEQHKDLPFDFKGQVIYYVGPTPAKPGRPIGSCGPTSSYRMDAYSQKLMQEGLKIMIGKGDRSDEFIKGMITYQGVYMQAVGGAGALLSRKVTKSEVIAYHDLGAEAIYKLEVDHFPVIVSYDIYGGNIVKDQIAIYQTKKVD
ncbi:MAG: Fe-S-containing hydro-lyase [Bacillota bacterium]|nr:MAG: Fe-S-containing hydro-lyase [Bacillota bacterium]